MTNRIFDTQRSAGGNGILDSQVSSGVAPGDTTAPTITLASSSLSVTVAGSYQLTATAADDVGVAYVEFYRNGTSIGADYSAPYTMTEGVTYLHNGTREYTARAFDAAGNSTLSAAVSVTIAIAGAPSEGGGSRDDASKTKKRKRKETRLGGQYVQLNAPVAPVAPIGTEAVMPTFNALMPGTPMLVDFGVQAPPPALAPTPEPEPETFTIGQQEMQAIEALVQERDQMSTQLQELQNEYEALMMLLTA